MLYTVQYVWKFFCVVNSCSIRDNREKYHQMELIFEDDQNLKHETTSDDVSVRVSVL